LEEQKVQNELEAKQAQQQKLEDERKQLLQNEFKEKIASSTNSKEEEKLLNELNNKLDLIEERNEANKLRMNEQLKKRLQARKKEMTDAKEIEINETHEQNQEKFEQELALRQFDETNVQISESKKVKIDGPLTEEALDELLKDSELCSTLDSLQKYLNLKKNNYGLEHGPITKVELENLSELESINHRFCLFLIGLFQHKWKTSCNLVVSETIPKPEEVVEFQKEVTFDKNDVIISRKILSIDTGKIAVILSYGFARMVAAESNSNLQNTFYQIQMTISNDLFMTLNSTQRNPDGFDSTIRT